MPRSSASSPSSSDAARRRGSAPAPRTSRTPCRFAAGPRRTAGRRRSRGACGAMTARAVDARPSASTPNSCAALREVRDLRSPDQGLRRDAPDVDSGAAERLGLDQRTRAPRRRDAPSSRCRPSRRRRPRGRERTASHPSAGSLRNHVAAPSTGSPDSCRTAGVTSGCSSSSSGRSTSATRDRGASPTALARRRSRTGSASIHAEQQLGLYWELDLQNWVLHDAPGFMLGVANWTYFNCQFTISFGLLLWVYFRRNYAFYFVAERHPLRRLHRADRLPRDPYRRRPACTRSSASSTPSPARQSATRRASSAAFANPYAAMPSLHTAYALTIGIAGVLVCRSLIAKLIWFWSIRRSWSTRSSPPATTSSSTPSPAPGWPDWPS